MPATAAGLHYDPLELHSNVMAGALYLRQMLGRFGSTGPALAAYNAGPTAVDRLGAAFRQWKVEKIGVIARHHVVVAFSKGAFAATDDDRLRWVVDDDGTPCPDCDDNALAGPTPKGEHYPTGQTHPPAHPGCRCVLLPA